MQVIASGTAPFCSILLKVHIITSFYVTETQYVPFTVYFLLGNDILLRLSVLLSADGLRLTGM